MSQQCARRKAMDRGGVASGGRTVFSKASTHYCALPLGLRVVRWRCQWCALAAVGTAECLAGVDRATSRNSTGQPGCVART